MGKFVLVSMGLYGSSRSIAGPTFFTPSADTLLAGRKSRVPTPSNQGLRPSFPSPALHLANFGGNPALRAPPAPSSGRFCNHFPDYGRHQNRMNAAQKTTKKMMGENCHVASILSSTYFINK